jgi:hypothetical protein
MPGRSGRDARRPDFYHSRASCQYDVRGVAPINSSWLIRKWYVDCVAADGTVWIGYWGEIRFGSLRVPFASSMLVAGGRLETRSSMRMGEPPHLDGDRLSVATPSIGVDATLVARCRPAEVSLHPGVVWRCVMPSADAVVHVNGRTLRGCGYAELLELTVAPWTLPLRELRWGRAAGEKHSLVWIRWSGANPLQIAVRDGEVCQADSIEDDRVVLPGGFRLELSDPVVIRDENLAATLRPLRPLAPMLPRSLTESRETKWRSRGTFCIEERQKEETWVIHERVTFAFD